LGRAAIYCIQSPRLLLANRVDLFPDGARETKKLQAHELEVTE